ncbi:MAG TPA: phosphotransferase family protein [Candidatus Binataceae bacterium]|nr:phosphotransferase family protein [Candidatus Binataceae bacterium]
MPSGPIDIELLTAQITGMVRAKTGDEVRIRDIAPLPGHAAFGCSFVIDRDRTGAAQSQKLVLRMAPEGVRASGPTDVVLQAKRMQSLADSDVPVSPILWYGDEPEFFGRPYFVAAFVESFKLEDRSDLSPDETKALARHGVRTLAALHRVDWTTRRAAWGDPQPLTTEIDRLDRLLDRPTLDPREVARAPELRDKLRATAPDVRPGCVHGDFQWNNILFGADRVAALIDWEMAMLGATLLDLGWLCFFADPGPGADVSIMCGSAPLSADEIIEIYSESGQFTISRQEVNWFRAFASFRLGALACFNVMLHRRGKRHDPAWETLVLSSPAMFENGLRLLG